MISAFFSQLTFLNPLMLSAFIGLPLLWYLLRITPPQPKKIFFPATRFLIGLKANENVPSKTPWWILLLRLAIAAFVILALSQPVLNAAQNIKMQGAVRIIYDNSWASAQIRHKQTAAAEEIITQAGREGREIYLMTTAPRIAADKTESFGALSASDALSVLRGISPQPYPADYDSFINELKSFPSGKTVHTIWLSHGLDDGGLPRAVQALQKQGSLKIIVPQNRDLPLLLRPAKIKPAEANPKEEKETQNTSAASISIAVDAPTEIVDGLPVNVRVNGAENSVLDIQGGQLSPNNLPHNFSFNFNERIKSTVTSFNINGRSGVGAVFLLDERFSHRSVGIVSSSDKNETSPLIGASFYLKRALEPFADISIATVDELLNKKVAMLILPDVTAMPEETLGRLDTWVKEGGLLLRFSGENTAKSKEHYLFPVQLRSGGRSMSGSLTWEKPQGIAPFSDESPLFGLEIPPDLTVRQQVLADPAQETEGKIWAQLNDGTPFITASSYDRGLLVLVHTTATPDWSDFALSGLYVTFLKRLLSMAKGNGVNIPQNQAVLDPVLVMDGEGNLISAPGGVKGIPAEGADKIMPSALHPPGIYGNSGQQFAFNLGSVLKTLSSVSNLPSGVERSAYEEKYEIDLMPSILFSALLLLIFDWIIMIILNSSLLRFSFLKAGVMILSVCFVFSDTTTASASETSEQIYAQGLYLAYIKTGDPALDQVFQTGLEQLSKNLHRRTSVEPTGVVGVDPQNDTLVFFPIIYWGIAKHHATLSAKALQNIQSYLDHGGTILFDTRDNNTATDDTGDTLNGQILRRITSSLNIPPISPIASDHVLGRSFYLLDRFPGRYDNGLIWLEQQSASGRDGVSSVIIGSNDWASGWAETGDSGTGAYRSGNQSEMSVRFGINLVMYALTGNYKADQIHIPYILERLGD